LKAVEGCVLPFVGVETGRLLSKFLVKRPEHIVTTREDGHYSAISSTPSADQQSIVHRRRIVIVRLSLAAYGRIDERRLHHTDHAHQEKS
jgi:hypothetical protein